MMVPKHAAPPIINRFSSKHINVLEWPTQSTDLKPIENLRQHLKIAVRRQSPSSLTDLEVLKKGEWANISVSRFAKLVETYPKSVERYLCQNSINKWVHDYQISHFIIMIYVSIIMTHPYYYEIISINVNYLSIFLKILIHYY